MVDYNRFGYYKHVNNFMGSSNFLCLWENDMVQKFAQQFRPDVHCSPLFLGKTGLSSPHVKPDGMSFRRVSGDHSKEWLAVTTSDPSGRNMNYCPCLQGYLLPRSYKRLFALMSKIPWVMVTQLEDHRD